jgi:hypothetical protein
MDLAKLPVQSELIPEAWDKMFSSYFDHDELLNAVKYGWDLSLNGTPTPRDSSWNHPSANNHASDVDAYIAKELQFGAIAGPMPDNLPFEVFRSPMGSVPKPKSDSTRTITDCSQGLHGINNWIDPHLHRGKEWAIHLPTGDDIVNNIARVRRENPGKKVPRSFRGRGTIRFFIRKDVSTDLTDHLTLDDVLPCCFIHTHYQGRHTHQ